MTLGQFSQPNRREKRQHGDKATVSAMTGDQAETNRVRERLKVLLKGAHTKLQAAVEDLLRRLDGDS